MPRVGKPIPPDNTRILGIKELKNLTGLPLRKAIEFYDKSEGNIEKAISMAKESGIEIERGEKRVRRLYSYVHNGRIGVIVDLSADTDFALNTPEFAAFAKEACLQITATRCNSVEGLMNSPYIRDEKLTFQSQIDDLTRKLGEKIEIVRVSRMEV